MILSDNKRSFADTFDLLGTGNAPDGRDAFIPTTFLVDEMACVQWSYRPSAMVDRLHPDDIIKTVSSRLAELRD